MILPMMGFFLTLVVLGGLASLVVTFDSEVAHWAPFAYAVFFAGIGAIIFFIFGGLVDTYLNQKVGAIIVLLLAPTVGLSSGAFLGYRFGLIRRER